MATDIGKIIANLHAFYNFKDRHIITVGAGGGQLIDYGRIASHVIAIDSDADAMEKLKIAVGTAGMTEKYSYLLGDFYQMHPSGDVVLFEFCLHEMTDPAAALAQAQTMAGDVVIMDHWPGSEWAFVVAEEDKVAASWQAVHALPVRKQQYYDTEQRFSSYDELYQKVKSQGALALARIQKYQGKDHFSIPMRYGFALI